MHRLKLTSKLTSRIIVLHLPILTDLHSFAPWMGGLPGQKRKGLSAKRCASLKIMLQDVTPSSPGVSASEGTSHNVRSGIGKRLRMLVQRPLSWPGMSVRNVQLRLLAKAAKEMEGSHRFSSMTHPLV